MANPSTLTEKWYTQGHLVLWAVFAILLLVLPLHYSTPDDILMEGAVSGRLTGRPEHILIFGNAMLGFGLQALYQWRAGVPWYGLVFVAVHWLSALGLVHLLGAGKRGLLACAALLAIASLHIGTDLQFTTTAAIAGLTGTLLLYQHAALGQRHGPALAGMGLLLMGILIRRDALLFVVPIAGLALLVWRTPPLRWRLAFYSAALFALVAGAELINARAYNWHPKWQAYSRYTNARSLFCDSPLVTHELLNQLVPEIGYTTTDVEMGKLFLMDRGHPFTMPDMMLMMERMQKGGGSIVNKQGLVAAITLAAKAYRYLIIVVLALVAVGLLVLRKRAWWALAVLAVLMVAQFAVQGLVMGAKDRIIVNDAVLLLVMALHLLCREPLRPLPAWGKGVLGLGVVAALLFVKATVANALNRHRNIVQTTQALAGLQATSARSVFLSLSYMPRLVNDPLGRMQLPAICQRAEVMPISWHTYSPFQDEALTRLGFSPDGSLWAQAIDRPGTYLFLSDDQAKVVVAYLRQKGLKVKPRLIAEVPYFDTKIGQYALQSDK